LALRAHRAGLEPLQVMECFAVPPVGSTARRRERQKR
jgi:hypothetical protein